MMRSSILQRTKRSLLFGGFLFAVVYGEAGNESVGAYEDLSEGEIGGTEVLIERMKTPLKRKTSERSLHRAYEDPTEAENE